VELEYKTALQKNLSFLVEHNCSTTHDRLTTRLFKETSCPCSSTSPKRTCITIQT